MRVTQNTRALEVIMVSHRRFTKRVMEIAFDECTDKMKCEMPCRRKQECLNDAVFKYRWLELVRAS